MPCAVSTHARTCTHVHSLTRMNQSHWRAVALTSNPPATRQDEFKAEIAELESKHAIKIKELEEDAEVEMQDRVLEAEVKAREQLEKFKEEAAAELAAARAKDAELKRAAVHQVTESMKSQQQEVRVRPGIQFNSVPHRFALVERGVPVGPFVHLACVMLFGLQRSSPVTLQGLHAAWW